MYRYVVFLFIFFWDGVRWWGCDAAFVFINSFFFDLLCAEMAETLGLDIWICGCMVPLVLD